jgi:DNA-binding Lrp family transcriptional regulator
MEATKYMTTEREFLGVWIPKEIYLHKGLTPTEKLLLAEITSFAKNGTCFASNEHFSDFLGISKSQVSRLITKFKRNGFITVDLIYKEGTKEVDKRLITPIRIDAHTPSTHGCADPIGVDAHTPTHERAYPIGVDAYYKEHVKEQDKEQDKDKKTNKKEISPAKLENEFQKLWSLYPKKHGKQKALQAFTKARKIKKIPYETIENGLYKYIGYLEQQGTEEQYIMHGSTWFSQQKWQDEYILTGIKQKPKNINEYMKQKYGENGGFNDEPPRDRKIINDHDELLPDCFQGF